MGKIKSTNTRYPITIDKTFKEELEEIASKENRSLNNLIITVLLDFKKNYDKKDTSL